MPILIPSLTSVADITRVQISIGATQAPASRAEPAPAKNAPTWRRALFDACFSTLPVGFFLNLFPRLEKSILKTPSIAKAKTEKTIAIMALNTVDV